MAADKDSEGFSPAVRKKLLAATAKIHKRLTASGKLTKKVASDASKVRKAFDEVEDGAS